MDELKRNGEYEYGYDHLYEQKKPADTVEDAEGLADDGEQDETEFEIDQDDYGDDEPDDTSDMENVLAVERIMREINVKPLDLNIPTEDTHGMLKRDMKAEALRRYEEAAQSLKDFSPYFGILLVLSIQFFSMSRVSSSGTYLGNASQ